MSKRSAIGWWLGTRILLLAFSFMFIEALFGDVYYYYRELNALAHDGLSKTLIEYPTPVVAFLGLPYVLGFANATAYVVGFVALMLVLDGWLTFRLWRIGYADSVRYWILAPVLLGPISYLRFDLLPAVLAACALLWVSRRPTAAGALVGIGAATKLWPALLLPSLWSRDRLRASLSLFGTGGLLAGISLAVGGWDRLVSPLTWQSDRGLQIESIWASGPMLARVFAPTNYVVEISKYQAFEISGPTSAVMLTVADAATMLGLGVIVALAVLAWRHRGFGLHTATLLVLAITLVMIVTNKTFSPQYVAWLLAPAAVLQARGATRVHRQVGMVILLLAALTQLIFPIGYGPLINSYHPTWLVGLMTLMLVARNIGVLLIAGWVCWLAWSQLITTPRQHTTG